MKKTQVATWGGMNKHMTFSGGIVQGLTVQFGSKLNLTEMEEQKYRDI